MQLSCYFLEYSIHARIELAHNTSTKGNNYRMNMQAQHIAVTPVDACARMQSV